MWAKLATRTGRYIYYKESGQSGLVPALAMFVDRLRCGSDQNAVGACGHYE